MKFNKTFGPRVTSNDEIAFNCSNINIDKYITIEFYWEVTDWCLDNIGNTFRSSYTEFDNHATGFMVSKTIIIWLDNKEDATAFKLRWG